MSLDLASASLSVVTNEGRKRIVVKVSGESLGGDTSSLSPQKFAFVADELVGLVHAGYAVCVVVGGGNIMRGGLGTAFGLTSDAADEAGMAATGVNAVLLQQMLLVRDCVADVFSRGAVRRGGGRHWSKEDVRELIDGGGVAILAGGMGAPGMSTDVPAVQSAVDVEAKVVVMLKNGVDGVYDSDPRCNPGARRFTKIQASDAVARDLSVMDLQALELAVTNTIGIHVVSAEASEGALKALKGGGVGTFIEPS